MCLSLWSGARTYQDDRFVEDQPYTRLPVGHADKGETRRLAEGEKKVLVFTSENG